MYVLCRMCQITFLSMSIKFDSKCIHYNVFKVTFTHNIYVIVSNILVMK